MEETAHTRTSKLIADLWRKNQPLIAERLSVLEAAAAAARDGTLTDAQRTEAESLSHKLAGSLGMFGYPAGTVLARSLEDEFHSDLPDATTLLALTAELRSTLFSPTDS